jgi:transcriptional regulator GlxA family with amidase domain
VQFVAETAGPVGLSTSAVPAKASPEPGASTYAGSVTSPAPPVRHLVRALDLADSRYTEPLTVDDLAAVALMSRAHFSREFKKAFGESPYSYLLTRRLERAASLLRGTDWSVADICMSVGLTEKTRPGEPA